MILMSPAERADVIVDFRDAADSEVELLNFGPDEPFGGGAIGSDFEPANPATTGRVMKFFVGTRSSLSRNRFTDPADLQLPPIVPLMADAPQRDVSLNEEESAVVFVPVHDDGDFVLDSNGTLWEVEAGESPYHDPDSGGYVLDRLAGVVWPEDWTAAPFGPTAALLGVLDSEGISQAKLWMEPVTENPAVGSTEVWAIHNYTMDAHPIHIHLVQFQVIGRYTLTGDLISGVEPGETGFKDTVIAYPGEITKVIARFDIAGRFVWHCHIVEHEDNEMMRPYHIGDMG
jgi:bilirubin oxidase